MMPLGYPATEPGPGYRRELAEFVHQEKYDLSKFRSDNDILDFIIRIYDMKP
jgi:hypothetical protein